MHGLNILTQDFFIFLRIPFLTTFFGFLTKFFDVFSFYFIVLMLLSSILILNKKGLYHLVLFLFSIFSGAVSVYILKNIFDTNRPIGGLIEASGGSFPSGHAMVSTIFFLMIIFIFRDYFYGKKRLVFISTSYVFIFLISVSRLYLGVHWFSDVFWGVILGVFVARLSIFIFNKFKVGFPNM